MELYFGAPGYEYDSVFSLLIKVKRGNLERKLDFGTCCSWKFRSKSKIMFVWEAHLSTVKASKSCLTSLLYLGRTADKVLRVQNLVGGVTWNYGGREVQRLTSVICHPSSVISFLVGAVMGVACLLASAHVF